MAGSEVPKGRSKETHELHNKGEAVFISFDIETAGEHVGIVQISAKVFRLDLVRNKNIQGKYKGQINSARDTATNIRRDPEYFNTFVKPESDLEWCSKAMRMHKTHPHHPSIVSADNITTGWCQFVSWVERKVHHDETAILVAWNGKSCDLKCLW